MGRGRARGVTLGRARVRRVGRHGQLLHLHRRLRPGSELPDLPADLASCPPYAYSVVNGNDPASIGRVKAAAGALVAPKDWYEATNVCAAEGKVLCGFDTPCSRSGCSYDHHYQWTGEECKAGDEGLPAACA